MGIPIFLAVAIGISLVCHYLMKSYILASVTSALLASIAFQLLNLLFLGYLDPLAIIAFFITGLIGLVISLLLGLPFLLERRKAKERAG